ncbi:hypothetical protein I79_007327 [Cricetulus griseus]|uniref:Uncharacterized protein n=1 Tax=Cricetulus griseus TaxID=10029 RepID=G3HA82_CRIGR|nr:hypothetical protein I79_007327 [Cricetulus griseus]
METLANFGSEAHKQQPRFLRRTRLGREGQCGSVIQPAGGQRRVGSMPASEREETSS